MPKTNKIFLVSILIGMLLPIFFVYPTAGAEEKEEVCCCYPETYEEMAGKCGMLDKCPEGTEEIDKEDERYERCYAEPPKIWLQVAFGPFLKRPVKGLADYIRELYIWVIRVIGVVAVVVIMIAGFMWLTAAGNERIISDARSRINAAITGLILASFSYFFLYVINPDLVKLKPIRITKPFPIPQEENEEKDFPEVTGCPSIGADSGTSCEPDQIVKKAESFKKQNSGPCHCACFVSRVLKYANCGVDQFYTSVRGLEDWLEDNGWTKVQGKGAEKGNIVASDGHIGISLGKEQVIHSGVISGEENDCKQTASECENVWHGLNREDEYREWSGEKYPRCVNNQTIKSTKDKFSTHYWRK